MATGSICTCESLPGFGCSVHHNDDSDPTLESLYDRLDTLSAEMHSVAELMRYIGRCDDRMLRHARELEGAAGIAKLWIDEIKEDRK